MGGMLGLVASVGALRIAFARVKSRKGCAGVDRQTVEAFAARRDENLRRLSGELFGGTYRPQPVLRIRVPKPGKAEKRLLGIPTVRDRVVQTALRDALAPHFEARFAECSYGYRPGIGAKDALREVAAQLSAGNRWVLEADFDDFFDTIPHPLVARRVRERVDDADLPALVDLFLSQPVAEGRRLRVPGAGVHQGSPLSPLLANIVLDPLDHRLLARGYAMVRYADDFVVMCPGLDVAARALAEIEAWADGAGLRLHPDKTRIAAEDVAGGGFDFLGYHFERGRRNPTPHSLRRLKDMVRERLRRGGPPGVMVAEINRALESWYQYFRHSEPGVFRLVDDWVRGAVKGVISPTGESAPRARLFSAEGTWQREATGAARSADEDAALGDMADFGGESDWDGYE